MPSTTDQALRTKYHGAKYHGAKYHAPSTTHQVPRTKYQVPSTTHQVRLRP